VCKEIVFLFEVALFNIPDSDLCYPIRGYGSLFYQSLRILISWRDLQQQIKQLLLIFNLKEDPSYMPPFF